eukprot:3222376-Rhodomonas_salina.1
MPRTAPGASPPPLRRCHNVLLCRDNVLRLRDNVRQFWDSVLMCWVNVCQCWDNVLLRSDVTWAGPGHGGA